MADETGRIGFGGAMMGRGGGAVGGENCGPTYG